MNEEPKLSIEFAQTKRTRPDNNISQSVETASHNTDYMELQDKVKIGNIY